MSIDGSDLHDVTPAASLIMRYIILKRLRFVFCCL